MFLPPTDTLTAGSTWHKTGDCVPVLAIANLYRIPQLVVFFRNPSNRTLSRPDNTGIQDITPSVTTLSFCSTWHETGGCIPILAIVNLYRILQLEGHLLL
jgi:hypothetical protein